MSGNSPKVVKLEADVRSRLAHLAEIKHRSQHWLMKEAIIQYIEKEEYREQINQETVGRWQEAEQGRVVSHQAVHAWLDTWGSDQECDRPPCEN